MIPFYFFYSMFGFQRTADLIWAAAMLAVGVIALGSALWPMAGPVNPM